MTAATETPHRRLTQEDLRNFDDAGTRLVFDMQAVGWTGYITHRGHAFMLAPDGTTTASVTRDALRGRSGRNARAQLKRWVRKQADEARARTDARHTAFGVLPEAPEEPLTLNGQTLPVATIAALRRDDAMQEFLQDTRGTERDHGRFIVDMPNGAHAYAVFDTRRRGQPRLVTFGKALTEDRAWELLHEQEPDLFTTDAPAPAVTSTTPETHTPEGQDMKVYVCKSCDDKFETVGTLGIHAQKVHGDRVFACQVEGCGKSFPTAGGLNLHRAGAHPVRTACDFDGCDYSTMNRGALARHKGAVHGVLSRKKLKAQQERDAQGDLTVTQGEPRLPVGDVDEEMVTVTVDPSEPGVTGDAVTVTSPAAVTDDVTGDVLMDYLLASPTGEDAEDLVAKVRAVVAAPIVGELRRLREENALLREQNDKLAHDNGDLEAKLGLLREALSV